MALVISRIRKATGKKVWWDGELLWRPSIDRARRYATEAEATEAMAAKRMNPDTEQLEPIHTAPYTFEQVEDYDTPLASGPNGNAHIRVFGDEKDTTPNGFSNEK